MQFACAADPGVPVFHGLQSSTLRLGGKGRICSSGRPGVPASRRCYGVCVAGCRPPRLGSSAGGNGGEGNGRRLHWRGRQAVLVPAPDVATWRHGRRSGGCLVLGLKTERGPNNVVKLPQGAAGRIKKALRDVELPMSSYDTAWVAMVPSSKSAGNPQFPQCLDWILENQHQDGSWGPHCHPNLMKDTLSSTLACVISLKHWNLGDANIKKGINFIMSNLSFISDEKQHSPIGFNIIFPRMIGFARDMGLHLPMSQTDTDIMLHMRRLELERYPLDVHAYLHMVDCLEGFGISWHFKNEIADILDEIYRRWLQKDEEINLNIATCAMAFRLLRMQGYDVSSDFFTQLDEHLFCDYLEGHLEDTQTVLELYKASQLKFPTEWYLEKLNFWTSNFLAKRISNIRTDEQLGQVDYALKFPSFTNLERLDHRRNIMHFNLDNFQILKTSYTLWNVDSKDILDLAAKEFNDCQFIYQKELEHLKRWIEENRLDQLNFARQKLLYCYFSAAATLFPSEMSDVRMSWAKNGVLTTLVDDFFDGGGSKEELINLVQLIERWNENCETDCCSEQVKILYSAIHDTVNGLGAKASAIQRHSVTSHIIEIWLDLVRSMMREAEWLQNNIVPTIEQYMTNGYVSFALGPIILPALYFVGPELCPDTIKDPEYHQLFKLVSTCGRLLNDIQSFEREAKEGKINSVSLLILESDGSMSEDDAKRKIRSLIKCNREELLKLVVQRQGSVVPRACKDLFWKMSRVLHLLYMSNDGFTSPSEMVISAVNAVLYAPIGPCYSKQL